MISHADRLTTFTAWHCSARPDHYDKLVSARAMDRRPHVARWGRAGLALAAALPAAALLWPGAAGAGPVRATAPPATCAAPTITRFSFKPRMVVEGQNATLRATITNCTGNLFSGSLETFGRLVCEAVDPIVTPVRVPSGSTVRSSMVYRAPDCTGQGAITGRLINPGGGVISMKVAIVTIVGPPPA
jgi:hypothetical protein